MAGQLKSDTDDRGSDPVSSVLDLMRSSVQTTLRRVRLKASRFKGAGMDVYRVVCRRLLRCRLQLTPPLINKLIKRYSTPSGTH